MGSMNIIGNIGEDLLRRVLEFSPPNHDLALAASSPGLRNSIESLSKKEIDRIETKHRPDKEWQEQMMHWAVRIRPDISSKANGYVRCYYSCPFPTFPSRLLLRCAASVPLSSSTHRSQGTKHMALLSLPNGIVASIASNGILSIFRTESSPWECIENCAKAKESATAAGLSHNHNTQCSLFHCDGHVILHQRLRIFRSGQRADTIEVWELHGTSLVHKYSKNISSNDPYDSDSLAVAVSPEGSVFHTKEDFDGNICIAVFDVKSGDEMQCVPQPWRRGITRNEVHIRMSVCGDIVVVLLDTRHAELPEHNDERGLYVLSKSLAQNYFLPGEFHADDFGLHCSPDGKLVVGKTTDRQPGADVMYLSGGIIQAHGTLRTVDTVQGGILVGVSLIGTKMLIYDPNKAQANIDVYDIISGRRVRSIVSRHSMDTETMLIHGGELFCITDFSFQKKYTIDRYALLL